MDKDLMLESAIQSIPYVGSSIATLYFGKKEKKRFERLESFYSKLNEELEKVKKSISKLENHNLDELVSLIEEINEKVENERTELKIKYYKNLFTKSLIHPVKDCFNERKYFVDLISSLTQVHINILAILYQTSDFVNQFYLIKSGIDKDLVKGFTQQLDNSGLINSQLDSIGFSNTGGTFNQRISLTELGKRFYYFCIQD